VKYKSRLEARWAVFFDILGVETLYEYEGYQLPSGWYLPDFYVPLMDAWFEVKPTEFTKHEDQLCEELSTVTQQRVVMLSGNITHKDNPYGGFVTWSGESLWDCYYQFCTCPICGKVGIEFEGRGERVCGDKCVPRKDKGHSGNDPRLIQAFSVASKYQFSYERKEVVQSLSQESDQKASRQRHIDLLRLKELYSKEDETK
jgi:hypothetical protein